MSRRGVLLMVLASVSLLGMLAVRSGAGITEAQAAGDSDVRCVGFESANHHRAMVHVHNAGDDTTPVQFDWLDQDGTVLATTNVDLPSGHAVDDFRTDMQIGIVAKVTAPSDKIVVDGEMIYDRGGDETHRRTVTCARVS
jgi:hypothetical protein